MGEPTLKDIEQQIQELTAQFQQFRRNTELQFQEIKQGQEEIKKRLNTFDSRLCEFSMRYWREATPQTFLVLALPCSCAAIAFSVAQVSTKQL